MTRPLDVAGSVARALRALPEGPEQALLRRALAGIAEQFGQRACRSMKAGEIGAWMLRWPRLDRTLYETLRRAWVLALEPAGVAPPVPPFEELLPETRSLPLENLWRRGR